MKLFKNQRGATIVELSVVMGLLLALLGYATINLLGSRERASVTGAINTLVADLKQQQVKSMVRDTEGRNINSAYGIYFDSNKYTIFHDTYTNGYVENFVIDLDSTIRITSNTFPSSQILFASGSGEVVNFTPGSNTVTIRSTTGNQEKTLEINRYGVITNIN